MKNHKLILALTILIVFTSLACRLPFLDRNQDSTLEEIPVSTVAAGQFEDNVEAAAQAIINGDSFTLTFTETQLTSAAVIQLQSVGEQRIQNLQIFLRDGQIRVTGDVTQNGLNLPLTIVINIYLDAQSGIRYDIQRAEIGPFPVPDSMLNMLTQELDRFIYSEIVNQNLEIENITISDGVLTIQGYRR